MNKRKQMLVFYIIIVFLFILSPFMINYKIFLHPKITYGKLISTKPERNNIDIVVEYIANEKIYTKEINRNMLRKNRVKFIYNYENPREIIVFSVNTLYLSEKMVFIDFLFVFISAVYFTIKQTHDVEVNDNDI